MKFLVSNTHKLQVVTNSAANIQWTTSFIDSNESTGAVPNTISGLINTATTTVIIPSPNTNLQRQITDISLLNIDTGNNGVTFQFFDGTNARNVLAAVNLGPQESIQYNVQLGFQIFNNLGLPKSSISISSGNGSGSVTNVSTGIGLTGGPITTTGTISANIANTTLQGVTLLVDSISSTDTANAATANAVNWAYNSANSTAQTALSLGASAYSLANSFARQLVYTNTNITLSNSETSILVNAALGNVTVTLPSANGILVPFTVKRVDSNTLNFVTVSASANQTIDNQASVNIQYQYTSLTFCSSNTNEWWIV